LAGDHRERRCRVEVLDCRGLHGAAVVHLDFDGARLQRRSKVVRGRAHILDRRDTETQEIEEQTVKVTVKWPVKKTFQKITNSIYSLYSR
jgi:hypothetical protein